MPRRNSGLTVLVVTVSLLIVSFLVATIVPLIQLGGIGAESARITANAVPSIEEVIDARRALYRLERAAGRLVDGRNHQDESDVVTHLGQVERHLDRYDAFPLYPGEGDSRTRARKGVAELEATVQDLLAWRRAGNLVGARALAAGELRAAAERLDEHLLALMQLNVNQIRRFTARIERVRTAGRNQALVLSSISVVLAVVLLCWASRAARRERAAEQRVNHLLAERSAELEAFSARVAHDVLSPLTAVAMWLDRLDGSADPQVQKAVDKSRSALDKVRDTIDGLLEFAMAGARPAVTTASDLVVICRDIVAGLEDEAASRGIELQGEVPDQPRMVAAHRGVLTSILTNLVHNGLKHLGDQGTTRRVTVHVVDVDGWVRVEVRDTGPGIPPELRTRVFDPYFRATTTAGGIGLGLATVRRLVETHGGRLGLESSPNGSTFWFELPLAAAGPHAALPAA